MSRRCISLKRKDLVNRMRSQRNSDRPIGMEAGSTVVNLEGYDVEKKLTELSEEFECVARMVHGEKEGWERRFQQGEMEYAEFVVSGTKEKTIYA